MQTKRSIYTIGHSTRAIEQFIGLLEAWKIKLLVDIRSIPKSRFNSQFNQDTLKDALREFGISYVHMKDLGGLRHARKDSSNTGWQNASFRGYADYMQTEEFAGALEKLKALAVKKTAAIMCAEALYWRCHRSLVADALAKHKWKVFHIQSGKTASPHKLTPFLRVRKGKLVYPAIS